MFSNLTDTYVSHVFRLTQPGVIVHETNNCHLDHNQVLIEPTLTSICHADLRYFTGNRRPEALASKLPMALLHEGVGRIIASTTPDLLPDQRVAIVPNVAGRLLRKCEAQDCCPDCRSGAGDNYCRHSAFLGSGYDGLAQSRIILPADNVIALPDHLPDEIAVLAELCSVSVQALNDASHLLSHAKVAVFGDGPVGYLTAAMLRHVWDINPSRLLAFGADANKLSAFTFATRHLVQDCDFQDMDQVQVAVECAGGPFSEHAINQAIDLLAPGGHLILMGVSEERVAINTRDILEKGITVHGSSRSTVADFHKVLHAMADPICQATLRRLIPGQYEEVSTADRLAKVMSSAAAHRSWEKTYIRFQWPL